MRTRVTVRATISKPRAEGAVCQKSMVQQSISTSPRLKQTRHGYLVKAKTGRVITPKMVKVSSEDNLEDRPAGYSPTGAGGALKRRVPSQA